MPLPGFGAEPQAGPGGSPAYPPKTCHGAGRAEGAVMRRARLLQAAAKRNAPAAPTCHTYKNGRSLVRFCVHLILVLDENGQSEPPWSLRSAAVPAAHAVIIEDVPP